MNYKKIRHKRLIFPLFLTMILINILFISNWDKNVFVEVLNCIDDSKPCQKISINYTIINCQGWQPHMDIELLNCEETREGIWDLIFIADPANYITGKYFPGDYEVEILDYTLTRPWDFEFLPDESILVTQRSGELIHLKNGKTNKIARLNVVWENTHEGLLGLAIDPEFNSNSFIYLYYTYKMIDPNLPTGRQLLYNRISQFRLLENMSLSQEKVLVDKILGTTFHSGGRLEIGPDKKLYATTGDAYKFETIHDPNYLNGKILRINLDGSFPHDNPFQNSFVYSVGHRNPQGLAWDIKGKIMYGSEHGEWRYDEINKIEAGKDYGYPAKQCENPFMTGFNRPDLINPVICFKNWTLAPSGMTFVNDPNSPWDGSLFIAGLRGNQLLKIVFDGKKVIKKEIFFFVDEHASKISRRLRDVEYHNNSLYIIGSNYGIAKITPKA